MSEAADPIAAPNELVTADHRQGAANAVTHDQAKENSMVDSTARSLIGEHCVVRTYSAGVHIGTIESHDGKSVTLTGARRLWQWRGAFTLSEVAIKGVSKGSRISVAVPVIALTEAIEIIPTTAEARETYEGIHEQ